MSTPMMIECHVDFSHRGARGRKQLARRPDGTPAAAAPNRVPRVTKLMALALKFERLVSEGTVESFAELARRGHVTRARMTQVMSLLHLAPDIIEQLLHLPQVERGRDPMVLRDLLPIAGERDWRKQRRMWNAAWR